MVVLRYSVKIMIDEGSVRKMLKGELRRRINRLAVDYRMWNKIMPAFAEALAPGVPMETGKLRASVRVVPNTINSNSPFMLKYAPIANKVSRTRGAYQYHYGAAQYYSPVAGSGLWKRHTPNTGGFWDENMSASDYQKLRSFVRSAVIESLNDGGDTPKGSPIPEQPKTEPFSEPKRKRNGGR